MKKNKVGKIILIILVVVLIFAVLAAGAELLFVKKGAYHVVEQDKTELFSNHKVLVLAPHQDDEINILGGVMEQYIDYGSEVYIVFATNGDAKYTVEKRLEEALSSEGMVGIDEDHVILLGYGDAWNDCGPNIYLAEGDTRLISQAGYMETHGTSTHPAFNDNNPYTRNNYLSDIKSVICSIEPDIIFCCDYDPHSDHRICSMLFEEAMGQILKDNSGYKPRVYKSLTYDTSYAAVKDFYKLNLESTKNPFDTEFTKPATQYFWADRVRFPVRGSSLSRSLVGTLTYKQLRQYESQGADNFAEGIINGDKIFWERRTDSITYTAVSTSSLINDFKISESTDLVGYSIPSEGVCTDSEMELKFVNPSSVTEIWLYDNPLPDSNVMDAIITFDNGNSYHTGELNPYGGATVIQVDEKNCSSITIQIISSVGINAGVTEVEVYSNHYKSALNYLKITDELDNFIYDYIIDEGDSCRLKIYSSGEASFDKIISNYPIENGEIVVSCPKGNRVIVNVQSEDGGYSDSVVVSNPICADMLTLGQKYEAALINIYVSILRYIYK